MNRNNPTKVGKKINIFFRFHLKWYGYLGLFFLNKKVTIIKLLIITAFTLTQQVNTVNAGPYLLSAHGSSTNGVTGRALGYAIGNCAHCHDQHASRSSVTHTPYTALRGAAEEILCTDCHDSDGPATADIKSQITKTYGHTAIITYSARHTISATLEIGQNGLPFQGLASNRHVECSDCHEPHLIGSGGAMHTIKLNLTASSDPLQGIWGVEPNTEPTWGSANIVYSDINPVTKEYQICFKCHSYYGLADVDGVTTTTGPSGQIITDQAMEFSDNLHSFHPVRQGLTPGTYTAALDPSQTNATWNELGTQTMYCSDCHGADNELSGGAIGPHGSSKKYMLKGTRQYWPASSTGVLWSLADIKNVDQANDGQGFNGNAMVESELFCLNCHDSFGSPASINQNTWINNVHSNHENRVYSPDGTNSHNLYCIACHSVIPHGAKRSKLIVYDNRNTKYGSDTEPYRYVSGVNNYAALSGFTKNTYNSYIRANCWSTLSGCSDHSTDTGGYETDTP